MRTPTLVLAMALAGFALAAHPGAAQQAPYWPADQEQRLKDLDAELLKVQRERFTATFFVKDPAERERLDKRFSELQRERRKLFPGAGS